MLTDPTVCIFCVAGLHAECIDSRYLEHLLGVQLIQCCCGGTTIPGFNAELQHVSRETSHKGLDDITDVKSTGRKRAAQIAPIFDGMLCEWAGLKFAGGGVEPIMGCDNNTIAEGKSLAEAKAKGADQIGRIHHGPDKNTLNNTPGQNLHRVCESCHQRWHALNNKYYAEERPAANLPYVPDQSYAKHDVVTQWTPEEYEAWLAEHGWPKAH